jgi:hypothetical protein
MYNSASTPTICSHLALDRPHYSKPPPPPPAPHCKENPIYVFLFWELCGLSPNFLIHMSVSDLYIPRVGPHISLRVKLLHIYECRNWETEHYSSVLEITVSFLGIHKWKPDIYSGFSPALHLQCASQKRTSQFSRKRINSILICKPQYKDYFNFLLYHNFLLPFLLLTCRLCP